jgi:hypothetical protein
MYEEGDSYETQRERFHEDWEAFWRQIAGPDEAARRELLDVIHRHFGMQWQHVAVTPNGKVFVQIDERMSRELEPSKPCDAED